MPTTRALVTALTVVLLALPAGPAHASCDVVGGLFGGCSESSEPPSQPQPEPQPHPQSEPQPPPAPEHNPAPAAQPPGQRQPSPAGATPVVAPDAAGLLVALINDERRAAGLPPLQSSAGAAGIAAGHSRAMAAQGRIWHNDAYFTDGTRQSLGARTLGENVAMNAEIADAHRRLMASPPHRANILNPSFGAVGIGVARDGRGLYFVTENFFQPAAAQPAGAPQPAAAPPALAAPPAAGPAPAEAAPLAAAGSGEPTPVRDSGDGAARPARSPAPAHPSRAPVQVAVLLLLATAAATGVAAQRRRAAPALA